MVYEFSIFSTYFFPKKATKTLDEKNSLRLRAAFKQVFVTIEFVFYGYAERDELIHNL